ncbi:MAG: hypothetical protein JXB03_12690 [Spirochaetales bacterium]|nr:hypothetical protein [Spirochaetales bacterium]
MYSAILLAGYDNKRKVERYRSVVQDVYGEEFIETGYKPMREFSLTRKGEKISKPLLQFTLEALAADPVIEEIVIVGFIRQIRDRLSGYLETIDKPLIFVDQNDEIDQQVRRDFSIDPRRTAKDSIGGNFIKGYAASRAWAARREALFVASDSPLTTADFINRFIDAAKPLMETSAIVMPAIFIDPVKDDLGRRPLLLLNDSGYPIHAKKDKHGRNGFRLSSVMLCNPCRINVNSINVIYSVRKALNPRVQMKIQKICRGLGYPGIVNSYFVKHTLSVRQCEAICSAFLEGPFRAMPMPDAETTYDFDGTRREYEEIKRMLGDTLKTGEKSRGWQ